MTNMLYKKLSEAAILPSRAHDGDAGWDLYTSRTIILPPNSFTDVRVDLAVALPPGVWGMITGRSSTIRKYHLRVETGIIDNGYRGEMYVGVWNHNDDAIHIQRGTRLAQLLIFRAVHIDRWLEREELPLSSRGAEGFGSSGE